MLPNTIVCDPDIDECALVLFAARLTYGGQYVMQRGKVQRFVRRGLAERCYWRALSLLTTRGLLKRRKRRSGKQGHGEVVDDQVCLPPDLLGHARRVEQAWFDGRLSVKALGALLYIRARADGEAQPWHIATRFDWSPATVKGAAEELCRAGLVERQGGKQNPTYRACNSQNPQSKKAQSKKTQSKKGRCLRSDQPLRTDQSLHKDPLLRKERVRASLTVHVGGTDGTSGTGTAKTLPTAQPESASGLPEGSRDEGSPSHSARGRERQALQDRTAEVLAAVAAERQRHTAEALAETEQAIARGDREPWTPATLGMITDMGVDVSSLVERFWARTRGRAIDEPNAYLLTMAREWVAKRVGTTREVVAAIASDRAAIAGTDMGDRRVRAQAESREALACRLGGGDMAKGYALLAAIPDSLHRRNGQERATLRPGPEAPPPTVPMPLSAVLPGIIPTQ